MFHHPATIHLIATAIHQERMGQAARYRELAAVRRHRRNGYRVAGSGEPPAPDRSPQSAAPHEG